MRYYIRYADDFIILSNNRKWLSRQIPFIRDFLVNHLGLTLHPQKIFLKTIASGVDFLGWINFPSHRVLRTRTKIRMMKRIRENGSPETLASYLGLLKQGNTYKLQQELLNSYWFNE